MIDTDNRHLKVNHLFPHYRLKISNSEALSLSLFSFSRTLTLPCGKPRPVVYDVMPIMEKIFPPNDFSRYCPWFKNHPLVTLYKELPLGKLVLVVSAV